MTAGLQVFGADGTLFTEVTDRLTRVVAEGVVNISQGSSSWVPIAGMRDDGVWFVIATMGNSAIPATDGFTVYASSELFGEFRYTVFRI